MTYTMVIHPDVEVYDEQIKKYLYAEVQLSSNCKNCHDNHASKFDLYTNGINGRRGDKTSLDKIDLLKAREDEPDLRGFNHYLHSDFGYYYYAPWWFDGFAIGMGVIGNPEPTPAVPNTPLTTGSGTQLRHISRRLSSEGASRAAGTQNSSRTSSETKTNSDSESGSQKKSPETKEEKRNSGRIR